MKIYSRQCFASLFCQILRCLEAENPISTEFLRWIGGCSWDILSTDMMPTRTPPWWVVLAVANPSIGSGGRTPCWMKSMTPGCLQQTQSRNQSLQLFAAEYWNISECSLREELDERLFLNCVVCPQLRLHEDKPRTIWHQCSQRSWPSASSLAAWQWLFGWLTLPRWWVLGSLYSAYRCVYSIYINIYMHIIYDISHISLEFMRCCWICMTWKKWVPQELQRVASLTMNLCAIPEGPTLVVDMHMPRGVDSGLGWDVPCGNSRS